MDITSVYINHRELASAEELEDWDFDELGARVPTFPASMNREKLSDLMIPDAMGRSEWEQRSPALGLSEKSILALEQHSASPKLLDVQRRRIFRYIREKMLQQLISCSGAGSISDLCEILRSELQCGAPSPAPAWYVFSTISMGPRKIGYSSCSHRGCLITESLTCAPFKKCSKCKLSWYCSEQCQGLDWVARHKVVCEKAAESRKQFEFAGSFFQKLSDASLTGGLPTTESNSLGSLLASLNSPEVASRISQRRADLKKEKNRASGSQAPNPLSWYMTSSEIAASSSQRGFHLKSVAIARDLVSRKDLNGQRCVITGAFSEASGRWPVRFVDCGEEKLIKEENLEKDVCHFEGSDDDDDDDDDE